MAKGVMRGERRAATESERKRYFKMSARRHSQWVHRNGIIGVYQDEGKWRCKFPAFLSIRDRRSDTALGAAMEYNRQMLALFGEDAVLCDVQAAMRLDEKRRGR